MFDTRRWRLAHGRHIELGPRAAVMGILNVTPDSFSDGGRFDEPTRAIEQARRMIAEGAAIIDIGGESTRPGAAPIDAAEEQRRVLPVIETLAGEGILLSIDTFREETARLALARGAHAVNDVWGLQGEPGIAKAAAEAGAGVIAMHTGRDRARLPDAIADQFFFLRRSIAIAREADVAEDQLLLDPGFGFAKETPADNLVLIARFEELHRLGFPLVAGASRKRFIGNVTGRGPAERDVATGATSAILRLKGAALFRVHDVAANVDALAIADAVLAHMPAEEGAERCM